MIQYPEYKPISLSADISARAHGWRNDPLIKKGCRQHTDRDIYEHERLRDFQSKNSTIKMFGIKANDREVGVCGFTNIDYIHRKAEFNIYIAPEYQRQNYSKLALGTLLKHGFDDWGFNRIWGEVFEDNPALDIFKSMGFSQEGRNRMAYFKCGRFIDSYTVGILSHEFRDLGWK